MKRVIGYVTRPVWSWLEFFVIVIAASVMNGLHWPLAARDGVFVGIVVLGVAIVVLLRRAAGLPTATRPQGRR